MKHFVTGVLGKKAGKLRNPEKHCLSFIVLFIMCGIAMGKRETIDLSVPTGMVVVLGVTVVIEVWYEYIRSLLVNLSFLLMGVGDSYGISCGEMHTVEVEMLFANTCCLVSV